VQLPALLLLVDDAAKLVKPAMMKGAVSLGCREGVIVPLGIVLLTCTVLYLIPRTAILGPGVRCEISQFGPHCPLTSSPNSDI